MLISLARFCGVFLSGVLLAAAPGGCASRGVNITVGNGTMVPGSVAVTAPIREIDVSGIAATLNISAADSGAVAYTIDQSIQNLVTITAEDGVLKVSCDSDTLSLGGSQRLVMTIGAASLEKVNINGAATVNGSGSFSPDTFTLSANGAAKATLGLDCQTVGITANGAASVTLSGQAQTLTVNAAGAATLDTKDLTAQDVTLNCAGAGSMKIYADRALRITGGGVFAITYWGNAAVTKDTGVLSTVKKGN